MHSNLFVTLSAHIGGDKALVLCQGHMRGNISRCARIPRKRHVMSSTGVTFCPAAMDPRQANWHKGIYSRKNNRTMEGNYDLSLVSSPLCDAKLGVMPRIFRGSLTSAPSEHSIDMR